jgi:hypothetical protein
MRTSHHHEEPRDLDALRDLGYEQDNVNIKYVRVTSIVFTGLMVATILVVGAWYWLFGPASGPVPGRLTNRQLPSKVNPNNPLLQDSVTTKTDIMTIRQAEIRVLDGTGFIDAGRGVVHIPIDKAMEVVASGRYIETGTNLPARAPNPQGAATPQTP